MCLSTLRVKLRNPIASINRPAIIDAVAISCSTVPAFPHAADAQEIESVVCKTHPVTRTRNPIINRFESRN
jgi:hypothetical protein